MSNKKNIITILLTIYFLCTNIFIVYADTAKKNILIISSSNVLQSKFEVEQLSAIHSFFESNSNIDISSFSLNSSVDISKEKADQIKKLFNYEYPITKFDLIIVLDDISCNFINKYYDKFFSTTKVLFCQKDISSHIDFNNKNFFAIDLIIDFEKTLDVALTLHPNHKNIYIPINKNKIDEPFYENILYVVQTKKIENPNLKFNINYIDDFDELKKDLENIKKNTIIIFPYSLKLTNNEHFQFTKIMSQLYKENIPSYTFWSSAVENSAVGGYVLDSYENGILCATIADKILSNSQIKSRVFESQSFYMFDYKKLKKLKADVSSLPKNNSMINFSNYDHFFDHIDIDTFLIFTIVFLILVIALLLIYISKVLKPKSHFYTSESQYKDLINNFPKGLALLDNSNIILINDLGRKIFNLPQNVSDSQFTLYDIMPIEYHDLLKERLSQRKHGIGFEPLDFELVSKNAEIEYFKACPFPWTFNNKTYSIVLYENVTAQEQKLQLLNRVEVGEEKLKQTIEYDKLKTEFFANLSHELKTPLNLIFSTTQLMETLHKNNIPIKNNHLYILKQNSFRMIRLINNLIDLTKMDCGFFNIVFKNTNLISLIENITSSVAQYVRQNDIDIIFDTNCEQVIMAVDEDSIERIILNLLSNAIKFTNSKGFISVEIDLKDDYVCIFVKDNGVGIPPDKIDIIFDRFRQVDKSLNRNHEGSGIGLSLVSYLVKLHGGEIKVDSIVNQGTTFTIHLPIRTLEVETIDDEIACTYENTNDTLVEKIHIEFSDIYSLENKQPLD